MIGLAWQGVIGHARAWLGVLLGVVVAAGLIGGGLGVGEALREALRGRTEARLGPVQAVVRSADGMFREALAGELGGWPVLRLDAVVSTAGGARAVTLLGVPDAVYAVGEGAALSEELAGRLGVKAGDRLVIRYLKPSLLPRDVALVQEEGRVVALPTVVEAVGPAVWPLTLALDADPAAPPAVLVDLAWLQGRVGQASRANVVLLTDPVGVERRLEAAWRLEDAGLEVVEADEATVVRTQRVLLTGPVERALADLGQPALTWFAESLTGPERRVAYGFVAARGDLDLFDDELALHPDTARRLAVSPGDPVVLRFPVLGRGRQVAWEERTLRFTRTVDMDPLWTPEIEGLTGRDHCRDWNPGIPVDLSRITDEDEAFWTDHGATPQAAISLAAGRAWWSTGFGDATSMRLPAGTPPEVVEARLRERLRPADLGLQVVPVRDLMEAAESPSNDFGVLFLGFESVLLGAAGMVVLLLFRFAMDARAREWALLGAVGWTPRRIRTLVLLEGGSVALLGGLLGVPAGLGVSAALRAGLAGAWRGAVGGQAIGATGLGAVALGAGLAAALAIGALALAWRPGGLAPPVAVARRWPGPVAALCAVLAVGLAAGAPAGRTPQAAGLFFGAGALALGAVILGAVAVVQRPLAGVGLLAFVRLGAARRPGRSVAVVGLLAAAAFLVSGVGLGGGQGHGDPEDPASGAGGFALYGESALPLTRSLLDPDAAPGLSRELLGRLTAVPLRKRSGDDASCLQLGTAQTPHLLGVDPAGLVGRFRVADGVGWDGLVDEDGPVPVIGDVNTVTWGLHRGVGDVLTFTDQDGRPFDAVIAGLIDSSVLQGSLLMDERAFLQRFPGDGGARVLLVDGEAADVGAARAAWERSLGDTGLAFVSGAERLELFAAVERTYVGIFRSLGGLGTLLGSLGVGVVLLRNLQERRAEVATLAALGWSARRIRAVLVVEHAALVVVGLAGGIGAGVLAAWPAVREGAAPWGEVAGWGIAALVVGVAGIGGVAVGMLRGGGVWRVLAE